MCGYFAVRETHRLSDGQTIITVIVGWLIVAVITFIVFAIVSAIFGLGSMGMNAMFGG